MNPPRLHPTSLRGGSGAVTFDDTPSSGDFRGSSINKICIYYTTYIRGLEVGAPLSVVWLSANSSLIRSIIRGIMEREPCTVLMATRLLKSNFKKGNSLQGLRASRMPVV